ncbi:alginate O-acetyltransferase AlgX-related protein [Qaidamihabitans albus]|uniref:alginate O-acetyltransferase AlgX-related protein n=1 Tax=Qaidamihabitans albus TaxID=2795733 RepID=UPI0018F23E3B|nr:hypothetical protein [Qaidamihabitans albus]
MATGNQRALPAVHEAWLPREHVLHRPRHARRQTVALMCAAIFFLTPFATFALGGRATEFENRALTEFPSPADGWSFFTQLAPWATDQLVFREQAVGAADAVSRGVFAEPLPLGGGDRSGPLQTTPDEPDDLRFPPVVEGRDGWLYLGEEIAGHCEQVQPLGETMAQLRRLHDGVEATGREFVVVIAPDKATMVPGKLPDDYVGKECHRRMVGEFWKAVTAEDYVVDLRDGLRAWGDRLGEPVYGPEDAHWSDEGGVLMARALAEKLRPGITDGWQVGPGETWRVPADLPPLTGRSGETVGRHYSVAPDGGRDQTRAVRTEYRTPLSLDTASGPGTYGLKVGLLADSFTIRALRYLAAAFSDMTVLHHGTAQEDNGAAAGAMLAENSVVVLEVAERSLVRGGLAVLRAPAVDNILAELSP